MRIVLVLALLVSPAFALADTTYVLKSSSGYVEAESGAGRAGARACIGVVRGQLQAWIAAAPRISVTDDGVGYTTGQNARYVADVTDVFASKDTDEIYAHWFSGKFRERGRRLIITLRKDHAHERVEVTLAGDEPSSLGALAGVCDLFGLSECSAAAYGTRLCSVRWVDADAEVVP